MIRDVSPLVQATLGTLFTWALTAAGAAVVILFSGFQKKLLDSSLGFAAGVMIAASYWSLLAPAIEMAEQSQNYGLNGEFAFLPVSVGFLFGGLFVYLTDLLISSFGLCAPHLLLAMQKDAKKQRKRTNANQKEQKLLQPGLTVEGVNDSNFYRRRTVGLENAQLTESDLSNDATEQEIRLYTMFSSSDPTSLNYQHTKPATVPFVTSSLGSPRARSIPLKSYPKFPVDPKRTSVDSALQSVHVEGHSNHVAQENYRRRSNSLESAKEENSSDQWKRIVLLIVAITVHNIPEGLAVGVGFGAVGTASATFENARNLAIGIGIQNFPEGLAVSLPLKAVGFSVWKSFWYGQLSGMVEPLFGILGALAVSLAKPLLPYALSFAAGAMIYVVVDDIIPEANSGDGGKLATCAAIIGFVVMMALDVGLGG